MNNYVRIYLFSALSFVISKNVSVIVTPYCPPAEEGKEYTMTFKWTPPKDQKIKLSIVREETAVASCSSLDFCTDHIPRFIRTTTVLNQTNSELTIFVKIFNMTRKNLMTTHIDWYVSLQASDISSCRVHFYTKLNINCEQYIDDNKLSVTCKTSPTYNNVKCEIVKIVQGDIANECLEHAVQYSNKTISANNIYYDAECLLIIRDACLGPVKYEISINVYPNISNTIVDKDYGSHKSIIVNLNYPILALKGCPLVVEENAEVICSCERSDSNPINISIAWFDNENSQIHSAKGLHILHFFATRGNALKSLRFLCKPINTKVWKLSKSSLQYSPEVITRISSMSCKQERARDILRVTCTSGRVFPTAHCKFHFKLDYINELIERRDAVLNSHETISNDPIYYNSTCVLNIPTQNLSSGRYDLMVIMHLYLNNDQNDISFGSNASLSIEIEEKTSRIEKIDIYPILPIFVANSFLVTLMFLYFYRKLRDQNNIRDNYDVINDENHSLAVIHASTGTGRFDEHTYEQFCERNHTHVIRVKEEPNMYDYID